MNPDDMTLCDELEVDRDSSIIGTVTGEFLPEHPQIRMMKRIIAALRI
jgi:hypothetical protein